MPRQARLDAPGTLHHVMSCGIAGCTLFPAEADGEDFLGRMAHLVKDGHVRVYAWTHLSTHFHLPLRTGAQPLAISMRHLLTGLAMSFNRRHKRR